MRLLSFLVLMVGAAVALTIATPSAASAAPTSPRYCQVDYDDTRWKLGTEANPSLTVDWVGQTGVQAVVYLNGAKWRTSPAGASTMRISNMPLNRTTHVSVARLDASGESPRRYCGYIYTSPDGSPANAPAMPTPNSCSVTRSGDTIRFSIQGADYIDAWNVRDNGRISESVYSSGYSRSVVANGFVRNRVGVHHFSVRATGLQKASGWRYCGQLNFGTSLPAKPASCSVSGTSWIQWRQSALASNYDLWVNGAKVRTVGANVSFQTMPLPGNGPTWHFSVSARNSNGSSPRTYCGSYTERSAPTAPSWCNVSQSGSNFRVAHQNTGADFYTVRVNGSDSIRPNGGGVTWDSSPGSVPIYAVRGTAHISVAAGNATANGASSYTYCGSVSVNLAGTNPPAKPSSCTLRSYSSGIQLEWSPSAGAGYYEIFKGNTRIRLTDQDRVWIPAGELVGNNPITVRAGTASRGVSAKTLCGTVIFF